MEWQQHYPLHSEVCKYIPTSDSLQVLADPDHHESAYFKINGSKSDIDYHDSESKPLKKTLQK